MTDYADLLRQLRDRPNDAPMPTERMLDDAADAIEALQAEIERLRAANAEQAAWIDTEVANCAKRECSKRDEQLRDLRAELDRERMRLAACGVVALSDTPESAARARDMHPDYQSASCDDVARRVDECIRLRAELAATKEKRDE